MITDYHSYKVEIKDIPFTTQGGKVREKTALLSFFNKIGDLISFEEFGFIETRHIYDMIEEGEELNLDYCYVHNFSLTAYRRYAILEKKVEVEIKGFSAKNAFFESNFVIDFSFAKFTNELTNFQYTHFTHGDVTFESASFENSGVNFADTFFRVGNANFSKTIFGIGDVTFKNAIFREGKKDFQYAVFGKGEVNFVNTDFGGGDISFINVNFDEGGVNYRVARFGDGRVDFRFAKFGKGELSFDRTEFGNGYVDFRTVEINTDKVNFSRSIFGDGDVSFEAIEVSKGRVNFKRAIFGKGNITFELAECEGTGFYFDRTNFGEGSISFLNSKFKEVSFVSCHFDYYLDLRMVKCDHIDLSDTIARDIIDLKPFDFKVDIKSINFSGMRLIGQIYIDWSRNNVKEIVLNQPETTHENLAEQFRILKQNFNVTGQYNDEDSAYIEFKRHESKALLKRRLKKKKINKYWSFPSYWFQHLIFDLAGQYATNPLRVLFSMLVSYVFFSFVYICLSFIHGTEVITGLDAAHQLGLVDRSFYISIITFLTIGYGDYVPVGALRFVAGIEGFIGLFLMSYFTVAFVRKILR